jgi:hypothetical protein
MLKFLSGGGLLTLYQFLSKVMHPDLYTMYEKKKKKVLRK